ncbi:hypothetical protein SAMN02745830_00578 [Streptomyces sp. Amel2xC10]|nr:hypothetical protein SAMN02745830_00578 [Streptomyces sp. Amel2xC10]
MSGGNGAYGHQKLRDEIDTVMAEVYEDVDNGVHRAGSASGQDEYEAACAGVFRRPERLASRLAGQRYLVGTTIIVPLGPGLSGWLAPHGRETLGGRPFGNGTPPGPVRADERVPARGRP